MLEILASQPAETTQWQHHGGIAVSFSQPRRFFLALKSYPVPSLLLHSIERLTRCVSILQDHFQNSTLRTAPVCLVNDEVVSTTIAAF